MGTNNSLAFTRLIAIAHVLVTNTGYSFNPRFAVLVLSHTDIPIQTNLSLSVTNPNTGRGKDINFFNKS